MLWILKTGPEGNPKNGFDRRRLERCWNLPNVKQRCNRERHYLQKQRSRTEGYSSRRQSNENVETPVERIRRKENQMLQDTQSTILELLRSCLCWLVNQIPWKIFKGIGMFFSYSLYGIHGSISELKKLLLHRESVSNQKSSSSES